MDGTSPGNQPLSLGNVWVGETRWFGRGVVCGGGILPFGREPWPGAQAGGDLRIANDPTAADPPTACVFGEPTLPNYAACGCYVGPWLGIVPPPRCPMHEGTTMVPLMPFVAPQPQQFQFTPSLSDADVERIARRAAEIVVELLRAPILPRHAAHISPDLVAIAAETEAGEP